uniref:Uncharacterized protein n=1 Tax=Tanacetum cinerariifolium TaxID=118510 RepID=A0A6L2JMU7_TANCI|nr:hypothetical protein [Tanacetum cinerariifolium]
MPKIKSFITLEGTLSQEEYINRIKEIKRLSDLKAEKEKSKQELRKMFNQATLKAQAHKWTEHEAKKAKMMEEYNHQISSITKINYVGLVINEPESRIFFMNGNTDIAFQRENEFHLSPITELIRIQNQIKVDSEIAIEMFTKMIYVIEARIDCIKARKIVEKNLDNVG